MDIIFLTALVLFIFYRLNKELGKVDENESSKVKENIAKKREEILQIKQKIAAAVEEKIVGSSSSISATQEKALTNLNDEEKRNLLDLLSRCKISVDFFMNGAKSAFEMVLKSFSEENLENLKLLLSQEIFDAFNSAINQRKSEGKTLTTNVISIDDAKIISAKSIQDHAIIIVKIVSKQINYISDSKGEVIVGRKDEINEIIDYWTFKKDINSSDPNWKITSTVNNT